MVFCTRLSCHQKYLFAISKHFVAIKAAGETCQRTDVRSLDSESNACHDDGSTASAAVLDGGRMDGSTTTIGVACADSGGSLVLILGDSQGKGSVVVVVLCLQFVCPCFISLASFHETLFLRNPQKH